MITGEMWLENWITGKMWLVQPVATKKAKELLTHEDGGCRTTHRQFHGAGRENKRRYLKKASKR